MSKTGPLGESLFKSLCLQNNWASHYSNIDENGWDCLIEFSSERNIFNPIMTPRVFVQIKTTTSNKLSWPVSIKNLANLINNQVLSYLCLLELDKSNTLISVYIVEFDKNLIEAIYKEIAEITQQSDYNKLETKSITINFKKLGFKIDTNFSKKLKNYFHEKYLYDINMSEQNRLNTRNELYSRYLEEIKYDQFFDSKPIHIFGKHPRTGLPVKVLSIQGKNDIRSFINHLLGLNKKMDIPLVNLPSGLIPNSDADLKPIMSIKEEPEKGRATYILDNSNERYDLGTANIFDTRFLANYLPDDLHIIRFQFIFFDIIISKKHIKFNFRFDISGKRINLANYTKEYEFLLKVVSRKFSSIELIMEVISASKEMPLHLDINTLRNAPKIPEEDALPYLKIMEKLLAELNISDDVYLDNILKHKFSLSMYNLAKYGVDGDIGINISFESPIPEELRDGRSLAVPLPIAMPINESKFILFFFVIKEGISFVEIEGHISLNIEVRKIHKYHIELIEESLTEHKFKEVAEKWINANEDKDSVSFIPNWE